MPIKTTAQQEIQSLHRIRDLCVQRRTGAMNHTRGLLSEYGIVSPKGHKAFLQLLGLITDPEHGALSPPLKTQMYLVREEYQQLTDRIAGIQARTDFDRLTSTTVPTTVKRTWHRRHKRHSNLQFHWQ